MCERLRAADAAAAAAISSGDEAADEEEAPRRSQRLRDAAAAQGDLLGEEGDEAADALPELSPAKAGDDGGGDGEPRGLQSAIAVWLTGIQHITAVYTRIKDNYDMAQRRAYGERGQQTGRDWADALQHHTRNRAPWQYPHRSSTHFLEDALEFGEFDTVDDSLLEKGNRRKKRLGDRVTMHGGTNEPGTYWTYERRTEIRDEFGVGTGDFKVKTVRRRANLGAAAQVQRLDYAAAYYTHLRAQNMGRAEVSAAQWEHRRVKSEEYAARVGQVCTNLCRLSKAL